MIDPSKQTYLRIFGWWVLLQSWGTLRFSDHRGLVPKQITVDDTGFTGVLSRSKTLGADKTVGSRRVFVHAACYVRERNWLSVGWSILLEAANFDRDYLLPVPTSSLQGCLQAELLYEAGFAILNRLLCALGVTAVGSSSRPLLDTSFREVLHAVVCSRFREVAKGLSRRLERPGIRQVRTDRQTQSRKHAEGSDQSDPLVRPGRYPGRSRDVASTGRAYERTGSPRRATSSESVRARTRTSGRNPRGRSPDAGS